MEDNRLKSCQWVDMNTHITLLSHQVDTPVGMHLHEYYEMEIVLDGTGFQNLNGTVYPLKPGSVYFLTPIDFHAVTPEQPMRIANLSFDEHALFTEMQFYFPNRKGNFIFQADDRLTATLQFLFELLSKECAAEDIFALRARQNLLELLLITVLRSQQEAAENSISHAQLQPSLQYLFCHFQENITLTEVASRSGYTPNYFSKLFRDICGSCFVDFLSNLRINYAKMLLLSTNLSAVQIAEQSGFGSASGFFRKFRQCCGCTPDDFRKSKKLWRDIGPYPK